MYTENQSLQWQAGVVGIGGKVPEELHSKFNPSTCISKAVDTIAHGVLIVVMCGGRCSSSLWRWHWHRAYITIKINTPHLVCVLIVY